jgi:hypothetical protein
MHESCQSGPKEIGIDISMFYIVVYVRGTDRSDKMVSKPQWTETFLVGNDFAKPGANNPHRSGVVAPCGSEGTLIEKPADWQGPISRKPAIPRVFCLFLPFNSGGGEIRTHGALSGTPVFKTGAFGRSATPPGGGYWLRRGAG